MLSFMIFAPLTLETSTLYGGSVTHSAAFWPSISQMSPFLQTVSTGWDGSKSSSFASLDVEPPPCPVSHSVGISKPHPSSSAVSHSLASRSKSSSPKALLSLMAYSRSFSVGVSLSSTLHGISVYPRSRQARSRMLPPMTTYFFPCGTTMSSRSESISGASSIDFLSFSKRRSRMSLGFFGRPSICPLLTSSTEAFRFTVLVSISKCVVLCCVVCCVAAANIAIISFRANYSGLSR